MNVENDFIKHIVATKKSTNDWPEWKKNLLGGDDLSSKSIKVLNGLVIKKEKNDKK